MVSTALAQSQVWENLKWSGVGSCLTFRMLPSTHAARIPSLPVSRGCFKQIGKKHGSCNLQHALLKFLPAFLYFSWCHPFLSEIEVDNGPIFFFFFWVTGNIWNMHLGGRNHCIFFAFLLPLLGSKTWFNTNTSLWFSFESLVSYKQREIPLEVTQCCDCQVWS